MIHDLAVVARLEGRDQHVVARELEQRRASRFRAACERGDQRLAQADGEPRGLGRIRLAMRPHHEAEDRSVLPGRPGSWCASGCSSPTSRAAAWARWSSARCRGSVCELSSRAVSPPSWTSGASSVTQVTPKSSVRDIDPAADGEPVLAGAGHLVQVSGRIAPMGRSSSIWPPGTWNGKAKLTLSLPSFVV